MRAVTGAAGFLGRELVRSLIRQGFGAAGIRCLVRPGTARERLPLAAAAATGVRLELAPCRLEDPAALRQALSGVQVVYHAAAAKKGPPSALVQAAVDGSEAVFRAALEARVERVVLVSSFGVMGVAGLPRGAVVDEDAFEGRNLPEGNITEDPRTATAAVGGQHLAAATEAVMAALRERLVPRA